MEIKASTTNSYQHQSRISQPVKTYEPIVDQKVDNSDKRSKEQNKLENQEEETLTKEQLQEKVDSMNHLFEANYTSIHFDLHEETERYIVQIKDQNTQKVIREIPTKEFLDLIARIMDFAGFLIDKKI